VDNPGGQAVRQGESPARGSIRGQTLSAAAIIWPRQQLPTTRYLPGRSDGQRTYSAEGSASWGINFIQLINTIIDQIARSHFPASGTYHEANRGSAGNRVDLACWVRQMVGCASRRLPFAIGRLHIPNGTGYCFSSMAPSSNTNHVRPGHRRRSRRVIQQVQVRSIKILGRNFEVRLRWGSGRVTCWPHLSSFQSPTVMASKKEKPVHSLIAGATAGGIEA